MGNHDQHGRLIAAFLREMSRLEGKTIFECVESSFPFNRCLGQGSIEAPRLSNEGHADPGRRGRKVDKESNVNPFGL